MDKILSIDIFRKLPKDLSERTFIGAILSIICTFVIIILATAEIRTYLKPETKSNIYVQTEHSQDTFHANLDIVFPYVPCDIIGLNYRDQLNN